MNTLKVGGSSLSMFDVYVDASLSFNRPERRVTSVTIPGRNGDLIIDEGTFDNVLITYPCFIEKNFDTKFGLLIQYLGSLSGYQRIECSNDSTHFRLGRVVIPKAPTVKRLNKTGWFNLSFDCKPQRFLKSGESETTFEADGTMSNTTNFAARPLITLGRQVGSVQIGNTVVTQQTRNSGGYTMIDCERMICYNSSDGSSLNDKVTFTPNEFPVLEPGSNTISSEDIGNTTPKKLKIKPNWWEL